MKTNSQNTNSQIQKLISLNLITRNKLKFSLLFMFLSLFVLSGCKEESNQLPDQLNQVNIQNENESYVLFGSSYSCSDDESLDCTDPSGCLCFTSSCCTREDLDPCDYANMWAYAEAVACELTKVINGCMIRSYPEGCSMFGDTCVKNILTPPSLDSLIDNGRPFKYCSRSNCAEHYCPLLGNEVEYLHLYMSIAYQNAVISYARNIAKLFKPVCNEGDTAVIGNIYFKACKTQDICNCYSGSSACCYDTEMRLTIEYYCCDAGWM